MAGTTYRQDQPTLQDLMASSGTAPPTTPVSTAAAPAAGGDQYQQKLLDLLQAPPVSGPAPEVHEATKLQRVLMGIGDSLGAAFKTYGAVLAHQSPNIGPSNFDKYLERLDRERAALATWQEKQAETTNKTKERVGEFLLRQSDREQARADVKQAQVDQRTYDAQKQKERLAQDEAQFEQTKAWQATKEKERQEFDIAMQKAAFKHAEAMGGISKKIADGDKEALRQQEAVGSAMAYIGSTVDNVPKMLQGDPQNGVAPMSVADVQTKYRRALDAMTKIGLVGKAREAADAYLQQEIGPVFKKIEEDQQNTALAAGSPQQPVSLIPGWADPNTWLRQKQP